jgi:hypothetical protein
MFTSKRTRTWNKEHEHAQEMGYEKVNQWGRGSVFAKLAKNLGN